VERTIRRLGSNLRRARLRRNLTIRDVADKIGTGPRAVSDAEQGKITTGIAVYTALLWVYNLLEPMELLAEPSSDTEGLALSDRRERARTENSEELDSDF
jgi:transcriptional regulator with XRE-family HTH domain